MENEVKQKVKNINDLTINLENSSKTIQEQSIKSYELQEEILGLNEEIERLKKEGKMAVKGGN